MSDSVWRHPVEGTNLAVLASCHIRPGGPQFPAALFPRLQGADLIVTLGDMGDRSGLDQLQELAPVIGVRGEDDDNDIRTRRRAIVLTGEGYRIGCVNDAKAAGLATSRNPFAQAEGADEVCRRLFDGPVNVLLHANAGVAEEVRLGHRRAALSPGSVTCPAEGDKPSFLRLKVTADGCYGQIIWVA